MATPTKERLAGKLAKSINDDIAPAAYKAREHLRLFQSLRIAPSVTVDTDGRLSFSSQRGPRPRRHRRDARAPARAAGGDHRRPKQEVVVFFDEFQEVTTSTRTSRRRCGRSSRRSQRGARLRRQPARDDAPAVQRRERALLPQREDDGLGPIPPPLFKPFIRRSSTAPTAPSTRTRSTGCSRSHRGTRTRPRSSPTRSGRRFPRAGRDRAPTSTTRSRRCCGGRTPTSRSSGRTRPARRSCSCRRSRRSPGGRSARSSAPATTCPRPRTCSARSARSSTPSSCSGSRTGTTTSPSRSPRVDPRLRQLAPAQTAAGGRLDRGLFALDRDVRRHDLDAVGRLQLIRDLRGRDLAVPVGSVDRDVEPARVGVDAR